MGTSYIMETFDRINKCINLLEEKKGVKNIQFSFNGIAFGFIGNGGAYIRMSETSHAFSSCLEILLERVEECCAESTYSIGDRFKRNGLEYILVQTNYKEVMLSNLKWGTRWSDPVKVADVDEITQKEMQSMSNFNLFVKI